MPNKNALQLGNPNISGRDFIVYSTTILTLAAAGLATSNIQIEADASFYCTKLTYFASIAGAAITDSSRVIPLITLQMNDQGSGRNLFNQALALNCVAGDGSNPFILPLERPFKANSTIVLNFANFSAATTYRLDFALVGFKTRAFG